MKHMLNTLYVLKEECKLTLENHGVIVTQRDGSKQRIVCNMLDSIYCFGNQTVTLPLAAYCDEHGISLVFLDRHGRYLGRFHGKTAGSVFLRMAQYRVAESEEQKKLSIAKSFLSGKLNNARELLMRAARETEGNQADALTEAAQEQKKHCALLLSMPNEEEVRAQEGLAAAAYFGCFGTLIKNDAFSFQGRNRRPPKDPVNALLSFLYTLLASEAESALEAVGLDPFCGMMHSPRCGRPALALDLMEELRVPLCDRLALALINRRQLSSDCFETEDRAVLLNQKGRKTVLSAWQDAKGKMITHPVLQEKVPFGLIPFAQARLLAETIRGDRQQYVPFLLK